MSTLVATSDPLKQRSPRRTVAPAFPQAQLVPLGEHAHFPPVNVGRTLTIIGNGPQAHLRLRSRTISKRHAVLLNVDGRVTVGDLASRTRTAVNGKTVRKAVLNDGDLLKVGCITFTFVSGPPGDSPLRPPPPAHLKQESGRTTALHGPLFIIGRRRDSDLALTGRNVGRAHAMIAQAQGHYLVLHLSPNRKTLLNGQPLDEAVLRSGQLLEIGEHRLTFEVLQNQAPTQESPEELDEIVASGQLDHIAIASSSDASAPVVVPSVDQALESLISVSEEAAESPAVMTEPGPAPANPAAVAVEPFSAEPLPLEFPSPDWIGRCGPLARAMMTALAPPQTTEPAQSPMPINHEAGAVDQPLESPRPPGQRPKRLLLAGGSLLGCILLGTWLVYEYYLR